MREDATTDDYRAAMSGEGQFGSLGYEWSDKPHRLVYDLCGEVDKLRAENASLRAYGRCRMTAIPKTDCQGEDPIMILIERLRNSARLSTSSDALNPVKLPIEKNLYWKAAEAIQTQALALDMQGEELSNRIEDHKVKDATIASLQVRVAELEDYIDTLHGRPRRDRAALSQHPGEGEKA